MKSVDTAPGLERLREPGFQKLSKLCCMRSTPTEMQSMNENDFECLAKTRVNTPPMAKMTDDELHGSYAGPQVCNQANEISLTPQKSASGKSPQKSAPLRLTDSQSSKCASLATNLAHQRHTTLA